MRRSPSILVLLLSLPTSAVALAAEPLAPEPDNGFVTEAHKTFVGKVVFAKSAAAVTTPEKTNQFVDAAALGDPIFFRAYLPSSLNNAFRAEGVECADPFRVFQIEVDGKVLSDSNNPYFYWEALDRNAFSKSTSTRYDQALNAKPSSDEKSIWKAFAELVRPELTPGEHKLRLSVSGSCQDLRQSRKTVYLSKALAVGEIGLRVGASDVKGGGALASAGLKDAKLEKNMAALIGAQWKGDQILKVVIVDKTWNVEKVRVKNTFMPTRRTIGTQVASKQGDACRVSDVTFEQKATGMTAFGPTQYGSVGGSREVSCGAIK